MLTKRRISLQLDFRFGSIFFVPQIAIMIAKTIAVFRGKSIFGIDPKLRQVIEIILDRVMLEICHEAFHDLLKVLELFVVDCLPLLSFGL
jgi:hypothetical protein